MTATAATTHTLYYDDTDPTNPGWTLRTQHRDRDGHLLTTSEDIILNTTSPDDEEAARREAEAEIGHAAQWDRADDGALVAHHYPRKPAMTDRAPTVRDDAPNRRRDPMTRYVAHAVRDRAFGDPEVLVHPAGDDPGDPIARTPWDPDHETAETALARLGYRLADRRTLDPWTTTDFGAVADVELDPDGTEAP